MPGFLLEIILIGLTTASGLLLYLKTLTGAENIVPVVASVVLMISFCGITERIGKPGLFCRIGLGAVFLISFFFLYKKIMDGMALYGNDLADLLGSKAGIYIKSFATSGIQGEDSSRLLFLIFLAMAVAVAGCLIFRLHGYPLLLISVLLYPFLIEILGTEPDVKLASLFYIGCLLELNFFLAHAGRKSSISQGCMAFLSGSLLVLMLVLLGGGLLQVIMPANDYETSHLVLEAKNEVSEEIKNLRYKKGKINSLPNGKLKECGAWTTSEDTALTITMDDPTSLYLRGFVGSVYDGSSWESIDTEDAYEQKNLFYWLHQDGFYGETQLSQARAIVDDDSLSNTKSEITIKNEKADSRYVYLPYETSQLPDGYNKETALVDSSLKAKGLFGDRSYSFESYGNLVKDFTVFDARVYQSLSQGEGSSYHEDESYYNTLVYSQDTQLSSELTTLFTEELGEAGNREQGHTDYYTAISRIRSYLEENVSYSENSKVDTEEGDFTKHFLTETQKGHSVHYATAATLMFRYYGIPSRYVEGYLLTPEDVKDKSSGDTIDISGDNGHAWTEIYIDGLGWVPIEMTPKYYETMEESDLTAGLEAKGAKTAESKEDEEDSPVEENIQTHWSLELALFGLGKLLMLLLIVFDIFCFLFILTVSFLRVYANYKRKKRFESQDDGLAVRALTGYARDLYGHGPDIYSGKTMKRYRDLCSLGAKAAFSLHEVSKEERKDSLLCVRKMKLELRKKRSWYENWIMKYIERLY